MIREDYCSPEVSKLLKEKGFDVELQCYSYDAVTKETVDIFWQKNINGLLPRCTHQLAMKWLRKKGIFILPDIRIVDGKWFCMIARRFEEVDNGCTGERRAMGYYDTYKETIEIALKYALENLI